MEVGHLTSEVVRNRYGCRPNNSTAACDGPQAQGHGGLKLAQIGGQGRAIQLAQRLETQPAIGVNHNLDRISLPITASTR